MTPEEDVPHDSDFFGHQRPDAMEIEPRLSSGIEKRLLAFNLASDWRDLLSEPRFAYCKVLDDCVLSCSVVLEVAIPVKRFGIFPGYQELPRPPFPESIPLEFNAITSDFYSRAYFVPVLALRECPEAFNAYLDRLGRALRRASPYDRHFGLRKLLGIAACIMLPDADAADNGAHSLWLPNTTEKLQSLATALRQSANGRIAMLTPIDSEDGGEEGEYASWLGMRSWIKGEHAVIDSIDFARSNYLTSSTDARYELWQRVTLRRKPLADALDQLRYSLLDVHEKIRAVFEKHAPAVFPRNAGWDR